MAHAELTVGQWWIKKEGVADKMVRESEVFHQWQRPEVVQVTDVRFRDDLLPSAWFVQLKAYYSDGYIKEGFLDGFGATEFFEDYTLAADASEALANLL